MYFKMKTIQLSSEVMVSDPCYSVPTWCQYKVKDVLPGEYCVNVLKSDNTGGWGRRCAALVVVHKDYLEDTLSWRTNNGADIGVDSGQCGFFSMETYRKDEVFQEKSNFAYGIDKEGDHWYGHMCDRTLNDEQWGTYSHGVVSSSGFGDGSYRLLLAKHNGKVVGLAIDFFVLNLKSGDFNHIMAGELV